MRPLLEWFARHGVAANLLMLLIVIGGLLSLGRIRTQLLPGFESDLISISVLYPGAAPEEVEQAICARIEEQVEGAAFLDRVRSVAAEGIGTVTLGLLPGSDMARALDEIEARIDAIDSFPEEAERAVIEQVESRLQVMNVAISGTADELTLRRLGERARDQISALDGVTRVDLAATPPYEISIELSERSLRRHALTFDQVARAVRQSSLDLPGGSVKAATGELLLRTQGQAYREQDFRDLVLLTHSDGTRLTLGEVATVVDGFAETEQAARFDGMPAVLLQIFRIGDQDVIEVSDRVRAYVEQARAGLPEGLQMTIWQDETELLRGRLDTLKSNAQLGLLLVVLTLALFLKLRLAFWVALGIPISYLGTAWLMPALGLSVNIVSLFGGIVILGMVVDDAIVVSENIYRHYEGGKNGLEAAIDGAEEVAIPVLFSLLSTVAAFLPLLLLSGDLGEVIRVIPLIALLTLCFSLVESLLVLPSHLAQVHRLPSDTRAPRARLLVNRLQGAFSSLLESLLKRIYQPILHWAITWRYTAVAIAVALLLLTLGFVAGGHIQFNFFPPVEADNMVALLTMPQGTPANVTAEALGRIEEGAQQLRQEMARSDQSNIFRHILTSIGEQPFRSRQSSTTTGLATSFTGSHLGEVNVELTAAEKRDVTATELLQRWRELSGPVPEAMELTFSSSFFATGEAVNIQLAGDDLEELRSAAAELKKVLEDYPGVSDVADSFRAGTREVKLGITAQAEALGLTLSDLALQVRQAFYGEEAQRIQRDRDEVKVMVRYTKAERRSLASLEDMRIRTPAGDEVPFSIAGTFELGRGFGSIERTDRRRTVNVTAAVDLSRVSSHEVLADVERHALAEILAAHEGLSYSLEGEKRRQQETKASLASSLPMALFLIYALLAIPFRSYLQPLIVMSVIPFGVIGAIWGHVLMGQVLTAFSVFGMVALTGVVVNDSLVLVDFINRYRRGGRPLAESIRLAGERRFRPIVLNSLTTFAGLSPLLFERSIQAQFLIPMATSIAFGVLFATLIILVLVPVCYQILADLQALLTVPGPAATKS